MGFVCIIIIDLVKKLISRADGAVARESRRQLNIVNHKSDSVDWDGITGRQTFRN